MSESQPGVVLHQQDERRRVPRNKCDLGIEIEWGAAKLQGRVREISTEAIFVELDPPLWIGAKFAAHLQLTQPAKLECVVQRVEPRRGMALSFSSGEREHAAIRSFLASLPKK